MHDPRLDKIADVLVNYSLGVREGQKALINVPALAEALGGGVAVKVLEAGGHPMVRLQFAGMKELMYRHASDEQLAFIPRAVAEYYREADLTFNIFAPVNPHTFKAVPSERKKILDAALRQSLKEARGDAGGCCGSGKAVAVSFPTLSSAQRVQMSLADYEEFYFGALLPDPNDPVGYWRKQSEWQAEVVEHLKGKESVRIVAEGTGLTMGISGRTFVNETGQGNVPGSELYVGPVEGTAAGHVTLSFPTYRQGQRIEGVRLEFAEGRVVNAAADLSGDVFLRALDTDEGARNLGELGTGTNTGITQHTGSVLYDEKMADTFHLALGGGVAGNKNKSSQHWDIVSDLRSDGRIYADDELIYENGRFTIDEQCRGKIPGGPATYDRAWPPT